MIKTISGYLRDKNLLLEKMQVVEPKELKSRKKVLIFDCKDTKQNYICIFYIKQSSRFLQKNTHDIFELLLKLTSLKEHNFKKKFIFIDAPLCSKAKKLFEENNWKVYHDAL